MNPMAIIAGAAQLLTVMAGAPVVIGLMRQVRARWEGRAGAGVLQPWRDIVKQMGKQQITPRGTIQLQVSPEVSALDYANAVTIAGSTIPALSTRRPTLTLSVVGAAMQRFRPSLLAR